MVEIGVKVTDLWWQNGGYRARWEESPAVSPEQKIHEMKKNCETLLLHELLYKFLFIDYRMYFFVVFDFFISHFIKFLIFLYSKRSVLTLPNCHFNSIDKSAWNLL